MAAITRISALRALFLTLDCIITATVVYTVATDGLPFRRELLTPWMAATLVDFYITVAAIAVWIAFKESSWISTCIWIILLICLGSITTCTYVVLQLFSFSSQDSRQDPVYHVLQHHNVRQVKTLLRVSEQSKFHCVVVGRIIFSILGFLMLATLIYTILTDGSPFRRELLTPWLTATLIDFYVNVVAVAVWVAHKETTWIGAFIWILLLICFGSVTTCVYIVRQLFKLSPEDPFSLIFGEPENKQVRSSPY
ncbi:hypothetical protein Taro_026881 [Colocasia esculenta]|uniref:Uncharacterized protein n=1 Tax=Colocasia esculenta TaxID=4460 RepID=A0A843VSM9_COLES|nr:hypothetical protein [Colocasia esculenta]